MSWKAGLFGLVLWASSGTTIRAFMADIATPRVPTRLLAGKQDDGPPQSTPENLLQDSAISSRRGLFVSAAAAATAFVLDSQSDKSALAYEKSFPVELQATDAGSDKGSRERKVSKIKQQQEKERQLALQFQPLKAAVWGSALWFLSGSRSNPLATPMANVLYDAEEETWLQDRNDGLFADLPLPLYGALAIVFFAFGALTDNLVTGVFEPSFSLPLAVVVLLNGLYFELGRVASGDKGATREEADRASLLETEFDEFASARLQPGGSVHRQEVTQAFRRYHAKYRQAESPDGEEDSLSDLQVERLIRAWSRERGILMSSSGFFKGIKINQDADAFVQR